MNERAGRTKPGRGRLAGGLHWLLVSAALVAGLGAPVFGQTQAELDRMLRELRAAHPKLVEVCFDVSGSMENLGVFGSLREALVPLLRQGLKPGDQVVITSFDTAPQPLFDLKLRDEADIDAVIDALPGSTTPERMGTNIRWPHHDALRLAEKRGLRRSFIILVSDSYNDTPQRTDRAWSDYLKYYTLDNRGIGRLTVYPQSRENKNYERLLHGERASGVTTWGIGVEIDPATGRPRERLPRTPEMKPEPAATSAPPGAGPSQAASPFPWPWVLLGLVVLAGVLGYLAINRPVHVSLSENPRRYQNFALRPRDVVTIGGLGSKNDDRAYPVTGPREPCAYLERGFRDFSLRPGEATRSGAAVLLLNNEELNAPRRIVFSDDIKVKVAGPGEAGADPGAAPRASEVRLHFGRAVEDANG